MDRGGWWARSVGSQKSWTRFSKLSNLSSFPPGSTSPEQLAAPSPTRVVSTHPACLPMSCMHFISLLKTIVWRPLSSFFHMRLYFFPDPLGNFRDSTLPAPRTHFFFLIFGAWIHMIKLSRQQQRCPDRWSQVRHGHRRCQKLLLQTNHRGFSLRCSVSPGSSSLNIRIQYPDHSWSDLLPLYLC